MRIPDMQTRFQAPIRHVTPATPEVSVPLNVPPVVTGSHPVISATSTVIIQDGTNPPIVVRTHPTGPLPPFPGQGQVPAFLRTYTADEVKERKQKLKKNLLVRAVILCILTLVERPHYLPVHAAVGDLLWFCGCSLPGGSDVASDAPSS